MPEHVYLGSRQVGPGEPCLIVAELGQNHSGDLATALQMMRAAHEAGADVVKFQKRTVELCIPPAQQTQERDTPWGRMTYLRYRERLEFGTSEYDAIAQEAQTLRIAWTASVWDEPSLDFLLRYDPPWIKIPSACLTDIALLEACRRSGVPVVASTGMSTPAQILRAVQALGPDRMVLLHCTSTYPCATEELNLRAIETLRTRYRVPVGYSGHHPGVWDGLCAAVLGASVVEKHFCLDRSSWGSDQSSSLEPAGFSRLVRYIRNWEAAQGNGIKQVYDSELPVLKRLRRFQ